MNKFLISPFILCFISFAFGMEEEIIEMDSFSYTPLSTQSDSVDFDYVDSDQRENLYIFPKPVLKILMEMLNENFEKDRLNPKIEKTNLDKTFLNFRLISKAHWEFSLDFGQRNGGRLDVFLEKRLLRSLIYAFQECEQNEENNYHNKFKILDEKWGKLWKAQTLGRFYTLENQGNKLLTDEEFFTYAEKSKLSILGSIALAYTRFLKPEDKNAFFVGEFLKKISPVPTKSTKSQMIFNCVTSVGPLLVGLTIGGFLGYYYIKDILKWPHTCLHSPIITAHLSLPNEFERYASFFQVDFKKNVLLTNWDNTIGSETLVNPFLGLPHVPPKKAWRSFTADVLCKETYISSLPLLSFLPLIALIPIAVYYLYPLGEDFPSISIKNLIIHAHDHPLQIKIKRFFQKQKIKNFSAQKMIKFILTTPHFYKWLKSIKNQQKL